MKGIQTDIAVSTLDYDRCELFSSIYTVIGA
jgi:hypothetical protein